MDYQEAIYCMKVLAEEEVCEECNYYHSCDHTNQADMARIAISAMQELQEYKQLGTLEEIKNAVDKQIPKSPTYEGDGYAPDGSFVWDEWLCPHCGSRYEVEYDDYDYCPNCGQHIDWSEEE